MQIKSTIRYQLTVVMAIVKANNIITTHGEDVENLWGFFVCLLFVCLFVLHCLLEYKIVQSVWEPVWMFLKKFNIQFPYYSAIDFRAYIYIIELNAESQVDVCTPLFIY